MRLVTCFVFDVRERTHFGFSASHAARNNERFLMRCAPQSAWISVHGTPQTFSLCVLKKCRYRRQPKRDTTKPSSVDVSFGGWIRTQRYDSTQRTASIGPMLRSTFIAEIG